MNEIQVFNNDDFGNVRTLVVNGEPWFVAADVCKILGLEQVSRAMSKLDPDEGGLLSVPHPQSPEKTMEVNGVNEYGLYRLVSTSNKPEAKKFSRWIIHEVLPSIRKTGSYSIRPEPTDFERMNAETANLNAKAAVFEHWMRLSDALDTPQHHQICAHYASGVLAGHPVLPLPKVDRSYSATEVASMLGITAHKVGMLANKHGLKTDQYGYWVMDKSAHSSKEVSSFRYNDLAVDFLRNLQ